MTKLADKVIEERSRERDEEFREQLAKYKEFKERMKAAGVEYGDKYQIPLMSRLGHIAKPK